MGPWPWLCCKLAAAGSKLDIDHQSPSKSERWDAFLSFICGKLEYHHSPQAFAKAEDLLVWEKGEERGREGGGEGGGGRGEGFGN